MVDSDAGRVADFSKRGSGGMVVDSGDGRVTIDPSASAQVDAVLTTTRAVRRRLDLDRPVDDQIILDCVDIAEQAPTGANLSSRRWIVVRDPQLKQRLGEIYASTAISRGSRLLPPAVKQRLDQVDTPASGIPAPRPDTSVSGTPVPQADTSAPDIPAPQADTSAPDIPAPRPVTPVTPDTGVTVPAHSAVVRSATYLLEHFAEVPVIVIPVILGRHDGKGRPGLFDSVIQSAWSFCLALRARGLGSAWTTAGLTREDEIKELLGIPADVTEIVMLPVAWTKGTDFKRAKRPPAREITYFDEWARTYEKGPSNPVSLDDCPGTVVEVDIKARVEKVWAQVTDINMPAEFSDEFLGAQWQDPDISVAEGAVFVGRNTHPMRGDWEVPCIVDVYREKSAFGWCTNSTTAAGARWRFELERFPDATRLRFRLIMGPGPSGLTAIIQNRPDLEQRIIRSRLREHQTNMKRVLEGVKAKLEQRAR